MPAIEETRAVQTARLPKLPPALAPFRRRMFALMWWATLAANFGLWIHTVGAAWVMIDLDPSPQMVALIQTATALPTLLFALPAGAAADLWDRRLALILGQAIMTASAALLALVQGLGVMTPWLLLALTFALSAGSTWRQPAYQASVGDLVPLREIPAAVTLNSVGFNLARSAGPALGGVIVAALGAQATFAVNAVGNLVVVAVLLLWRRRIRHDDLPREHLGPAMAAGLRYVLGSPVILTVVLRGALFGALAGALWALLPVVADRGMGGGAFTYGLLLGALGVGAVLGGVVIGELREKLRGEGVQSLGHVLFAAASVALGLVDSLPLALPFLVAGGAAWMIVLSSFNVTVQLSAAAWVKARALSVYFMATFGGMALGSWAWGYAAEVIGVDAALIAAGLALLIDLPLSRYLRLPNELSRDLTTPLPIPPIPEVAPGLPLDPEHGLVAVTVTYEVAPKRAAAFIDAMRDLRRLRRRDGALRWTLYQDVARPRRWIEAFVLASWYDSLRHMRRMTVADQAALDRVNAFHEGGEPPEVSHLVARGVAHLGWPPGALTAAAARAPAPPGLG